MKVKPALAFRIITAAVGAVADIAEATREDSPGGKKITPAEAEAIWEDFARKLKPRFMRELGAHDAEHDPGEVQR